MFKHYVKRTIKKIFALPLWIIFNIFHLLSKLLSLILHLISRPGAVLILVVAAINYFNEGYSNLTTQMLLIALAMVAAYVISPYITSWTYNMKSYMKQIALKPIVIRPPVRYTVESIF